MPRLSMRLDEKQYNFLKTQDFIITNAVKNLINQAMESVGQNKLSDMEVVDSLAMETKSKKKVEKKNKVSDKPKKRMTSKKTAHDKEMIKKYGKPQRYPPKFPNESDKLAKIAELKEIVRKMGGAPKYDILAGVEV